MPDERAGTHLPWVGAAVGGGGRRPAPRGRPAARRHLGPWGATGAGAVGVCRPDGAGGPRDESGGVAPAADHHPESFSLGGRVRPRGRGSRGTGESGGPGGDGAGLGGRVDRPRFQPGGLPGLVPEGPSRSDDARRRLGVRPGSVAAAGRTWRGGRGARFCGDGAARGLEPARIAGGGQPGGALGAIGASRGTLSWPTGGPGPGRPQPAPSPSGAVRRAAGRDRGRLAGRRDRSPAAAGDGVAGPGRPGSRARPHRR